MRVQSVMCGKLQQSTWPERRDLKVIGASSSSTEKSFDASSNVISEIIIAFAIHKQYTFKLPAKSTGIYEDPSSQCVHSSPAHQTQTHS